MTKHVKNSILLIFISIFLSGCSWVEYFVISNTSEETVKIQLELKSVKTGFLIFSNNIDFYKYNQKTGIDWASIYDGKEEVSNDSIINFTLASNNAAIFGHLNNDHYTELNQYFINRRIVNFKKLTLYFSNDTLIVTPENFDQFFKNNDGLINLVIKK